MCLSNTPRTPQKIALSACHLPDESGVVYSIFLQVVRNCWLARDAFFSQVTSNACCSQHAANLGSEGSCCNRGVPQRAGRSKDVRLADMLQSQPRRCKLPDAIVSPGGHRAEGDIQVPAPSTDVCSCTDPQNEAQLASLLRAKFQLA